MDILIDWCQLQSNICISKLTLCKTKQASELQFIVYQFLMVATNCLLIGISSFFFFLLSLGTGIHMLKGFYSSWECDSYSMGTTSYKIASYPTFFDDPLPRQFYLCTRQKNLQNTHNHVDPTVYDLAPLLFWLVYA